jgi:hypothetical protein
MFRRPPIPTRRTQVVKSTHKPSQKLSKLIQEGLALHNAGQINEAKHIYEQILKFIVE